MADRIPARLTPAEGRKFGLTVGIAFGVLGGIAFWRHHPTSSTVLWSLGGALILGGLVFPTAMGPVQRAWMGLAHAISRVTTPIIMGLLYYVVITPIGLVMRLVGHRPLVHQGKTSLWIERAEGDRRGDLERQF